MKVSSGALIGGIVACFVTVVLASVTVVVLVPDQSAVALTTALLGSLTSTIAVLAALAKVSAVDEKVEYLANGGTDAKIRAGIADVVKPELLRADADTDELLAADRAHRAASPANKPHSAASQAVAKLLADREG